MPRELMRLRSVVTVFCITVLSGFEANAQVNVRQEHNNASRDGVYVDAAFTLSAAANLTRDLNFDGTISGNVYAQPLYIEGGPNGPMIIAVTESNNVYALNATTGTIIWQRNLGAPVPLNRLGCGNIDPVGITSTPVVDLASRALFLDAFTTPDGGAFAIAAVVEHFSEAVVENPIVGQKSENPQLREWHTNNLGRLPGLKFMRTLWVCNVAGGPQQYAATKPGSTSLGLEEAHRDLKISPAEFDEVAAELGRTLDFFTVPQQEKDEVLAAFAAHKGEVTEGFQ